MASPYLLQPTKPCPQFLPGDKVVGFFGKATVLSVYWEVPRVGSWDEPKPHWRARIQYGPLADAPIYNVPMRHLKAVPATVADTGVVAQLVGRAA